MNTKVLVAAGTLVVEAAQQADIDIHIPCGGQGRCGRCAVVVENGHVRRRSTLRLSPVDVAAGYALACQSVIEGDTVITLLPQEKVERRLTTDRTAIDERREMAASMCASSRPEKKFPSPGIRQSARRTSSTP